MGPKPSSTASPAPPASEPSLPLPSFQPAGTEARFHRAGAPPQPHHQVLAPSEVTSPLVHGFRHSCLGGGVSTWPTLTLSLQECSLPSYLCPGSASPAASTFPVALTCHPVPSGCSAALQRSLPEHNLAPALRLCAQDGGRAQAPTDLTAAGQLACCVAPAGVLTSPWPRSPSAGQSEWQCLFQKCHTRTEGIIH